MIAATNAVLDLSVYTRALTEREVTRVAISHLQQDIDARKLFITPQGADYKALGSNEAERKNALETIFAKDAAINEMLASLREMETALGIVSATVAEQEALRRAYEWSITDRLADALAALAAAKPDHPGANPGRSAAAAVLPAASAAAYNNAYSTNSDDEIPF